MIILHEMCWRDFVKCKYFHRNEPLSFRILEAKDQLSIVTHALIRRHVPSSSYRRLILL
jgi:hypothetical protein